MFGSFQVASASFLLARLLSETSLHNYPHMSELEKHNLKLYIIIIYIIKLLTNLGRIRTQHKKVELVVGELAFFSK